MRAALIFTCLALSAVAAFYGQPLVHENGDAVLIIITVMTVFAGFLVAIITIIGDPSMLPDGSWHAAEMRRDKIEAQLTRHIWLFVFYLISIGLLFIGVLVNNKAAPHIVSEESKIWIERAYMFFAVASFFFTFGLPRALWKFQMSRVDAVIRQRRKDAGLKD